MFPNSIRLCLSVILYVVILQQTCGIQQGGTPNAAEMKTEDLSFASVHSIDEHAPHKRRMLRSVDNNIYRGENNTVVSGQFNVFNGHGSKVTGDSNVINGNNCTVEGSNNVVTGDNNVLVGDNVVLTGKDNSIHASNAAFTVDNLQN